MAFAQIMHTQKCMFCSHVKHGNEFTTEVQRIYKQNTTPTRTYTSKRFYRKIFQKNNIGYVWPQPHLEQKRYAVKGDTTFLQNNNNLLFIK